MKDPRKYTPLESTQAIFVDTLEEVDQMLQELKKAEEIAVDLEHHDELSYIGLTSLMQISTRTQDWIVDTLKPWRTHLHVLNEVFADPKIVKVRNTFLSMLYHSQDSDFSWCLYGHYMATAGSWTLCGWIV
jgi:exosome complex exonuclease RRP6